MKITVLLALICLQLSAAGISQTITLSEKNASLEAVFKKIEKQSGYFFFYSTDHLKDAKKITIDISNGSLTEALDKCLLNQPLTYLVIEKNIFIKRKEQELANGHRPDTNITGRITNEKGEPLIATIMVKGTTNSTTSIENGEFSLNNVATDATLIITSISFEKKEIKINGQEKIIIQLRIASDGLDSVSIIYNTGYQYIPKERATGSFTHIDNELFNRRVSTNILERLNGVASGLLFDANTATSTGFNVRGRSTLFANADPLIVLDNFPYDGNINAINPNDVESITILKDAAAASIWGARASNGVVIITTKKGRLNQPMQVSFNSNVTIGEKPDLYAIPNMQISEIINVERFLFDKGAFNSRISAGYERLSPVIEILLAKRIGTISENEATSKLTELSGQDNRNDFLNHYYRYPINQQYAVNLNGGGQNNKYDFSVGYDKNLQNVNSNSSSRITIKAGNTYSMLKNKIELLSNFYFSYQKDYSSTGVSSLTPYERLVDDAENPRTMYPYRKEWVDSTTKGRLLDWSERPLDELLNVNNNREQINYFFQGGIKYKILKSLDANIVYQYSRGTNDLNTLYSQDYFYTRDLINQFSEFNGSNITRHVPMGDILDKNNSTFFSHTVRGQISYTDSWGKKGNHAVSVIAGLELKNYNLHYDITRLYGFDQYLGSIAPVDYVNFYPTLVTGGYANIPNPMSIGSLTDRYISYYVNGAYTFRNKYTITGSARKDQSNLFGVKANQKGVPLWSTGFMWAIDKEAFYKSQWVPELRMRVTYGVNGNVDKSISAFTTAEYNGTNVFGAPYSTILNPPNPSLKWERVRTANLGVDFSIAKGRISGTLEYYLKEGKDIIGNSPISPSSGVTQFKGNSADIKGKGFDVVINSENIRKPIKWNTTLLLSKNEDKVTSYKVKTAPLGFHEGYAFNSLFSYRWAGLDPLTGDPQGFLNNKVSKSWATIVNTDSIGDNIKYSGSGIPTVFGSLRNTVSWKSLSISFNITYKLGYYFRASSINYNALFNSLTGHKDFSSRWQKVGDEQNTHVPSLTYPLDFARDPFYEGSEILIEKGSHIRWQDLQISYQLNRSRITRLPVKGITIYAYGNNLGIIWISNKKGIDPEYQGIPPQKSFAIGLKADF